MPLYPLLLIAFPVAAHAGVSTTTPLPAVLLLLGITATGVYRAWRRNAPSVAMAHGVALVALGLLLWLDLEAYALFATPEVITLLLAYLFAVTLLPGRIPLVTRFASAVDGDLPPEVARYTRQATVAWALFLVLLHLEGWALLLLATPEFWSLFANGLNYLFILLFFALEFAVRRRRLPHWEKRSFGGFLVALSRTDLRRLMSS